MAAGSLSGLALIVRRSLRQHLLSTVITVLSAAFGCSLVMAVYSVSEQSRLAFSGGSGGFDAVLGARGSQLQLVLNAIFHLETSPGNIDWHLYEEIKDDPRVEVAIPYAVGDSYEGFRVVGTTTEIFETAQDAFSNPIALRDGGRIFDPERREAVLGVTVARETGLRVGDTFQPTHGISSAHEGHDHEEQFLVVGILDATSSPLDQVVWIPIEGVFRMEGHVLHGAGEEFHPEAGEEIPEEHLEVSAVLLRFGSPQAGFQLRQKMNREGAEATLAWPIGQTMAELFDKLGWVNRILELVATLIVFLAGGSILACLYNTMNERRREFAILRALGAKKRTVFAAILLESTTIATLGSLIGFLLYGGLILGAAAIIRSETGVVLDLTRVHPALLLTPFGMIGLGALAGVIPAIKAYSTDVAEQLNPAA